MIDFQTFHTLPDTAHLTIAELETSKTRGRRGVVLLSASQIRRLEARGQFPKSRSIGGTRSRFYLAGEVRKWLQGQSQSQSQGQSQSQSQGQNRA